MTNAPDPLAIIIAVILVLAVVAVLSSGSGRRR